MNPKPELLIRQHRLLPWGSSELPAGPTSTTQAPYPAQRPRNLLPPPSGFHASAAAHKPPRRRAAAPTSGPRPRPPGRAESARPPAWPARFPQPGPRAPGHGPALPPPLRGAARAPLAEPAGALPAPRPARTPPAAAPCPLAGSPALGWTASAARTRLRFRLRLVQTA